eukprot:TRINITY_DN3237_c0_g1_i3.p1 TRINITY_DN3237_c0_g1~~TRINITY_DN3237_c0_g1_i3.p1  ORF type:complete len:1135 (+),score=180.88 TRINITY_DN3237_c0_g1_i3:29-3433(+)
MTSPDLSNSGSLSARDTTNYTRINILEADNHFYPEDINVCRQLKESINLRNKYMYKPNISSSTPRELQRTNHIFRHNDKGELHIELEGRVLFKQPSLEEFILDYTKIFRLCHDPAANAFCQRRLKINETRFELHILLNARLEQRAQQYDPSDHFNVVRVDNHVHLASAMDSHSLLKFIKKKIKRCPNDVVYSQDGEKVTLKEAYDKLGIPVENFSVDALECRATQDTFHRFDHYTLKYNPQTTELRKIFLKIENEMKGQYFAEITKQLFSSFEEKKFITSEPRVTIYGRTPTEWTTLSEWVVDNQIFSSNVRWLIQLPRLYSLHKNILKVIDTFQDLLDNMFMPLFEVTRDPSSNPKLHEFLRTVVGFDSVDDESKPEIPMDRAILVPAKEWSREENPPYSYYSFYFYSYVNLLNKFRESRGLTTFAFRPHCGESGNPFTHLSSAFLLAESINHGIQLRKSAVLQYLFFISQIGLAMSPLSNNHLFLEYSANPFYMFFMRGLNVTLSTDDPLQFHHTDQALLEEYSVAAQYWKLSSCDVCEIARNSVLQSGFPHEVKQDWIGDNYRSPGVKGNDVRRTNIPSIRISFREETYNNETRFLETTAKVSPEELANNTNKNRKAMMINPNILSRIKIGTEFIQPRSEVRISSKQTYTAFLLRNKYTLNLVDSEEEMHLTKELATSGVVFGTQEGVPVLQDKEGRLLFSPSFTLKNYLDDFNYILSLCSNGPAKSFCHKRLTILNKTFQLHELLNSPQEYLALKTSNRNFFKTHCVDQANLVTATHPSYLFDYINKKVKGFPNQPALRLEHEQNGKNHQTLKELHEESGFFNMPVMEMHKYTIQNNFLSDNLQQVFLDIDNLVDGSYYADLAAKFFRIDENQYQRVELRVILPCRRNTGGWARLANWAINHNLLHPTHVRWVVEIPAVFRQWLEKKSDKTTFQEFLDEIFKPLFDVTLNPNSNRKLKLFLEHVTSLVFTADERFSERFMSLSWLPTSPSGWSHKTPPFGYYCYYLYANLFVLNRLRVARNLNTISFRTECGRDGDNSINLAFSYLISDGVYQGILLQKSPVLEYLYYLAQIPLFISPCIFNRNKEHPFAHFFKAGLRTSIVTTGSNLHFTHQPLLEQLTIATRVVLDFS